jgi:hypothetical protein
VPAHTAPAGHCGRSGAGVRLNSALMVIELYQGVVRAFQRSGKDYELRWGQLYTRTIAAVADRRYACRAGAIQHLADTHAWRRSLQEAEVRPF